MPRSLTNDLVAQWSLLVDDTKDLFRHVPMCCSLELAGPSWWKRLTKRSQPLDGPSIATPNLRLHDKHSCVWLQLTDELLEEMAKPVPTVVEVNPHCDAEAEDHVKRRLRAQRGLYSLVVHDIECAEANSGLWSWGGSGRKQFVQKHRGVQVRTIDESAVNIEAEHVASNAVLSVHSLSETEADAAFIAANVENAKRTIRRRKPCFQFRYKVVKSAFDFVELVVVWKVSQLMS